MLMKMFTRATRAISRFLPCPQVLTGDDIEAVKAACERSYTKDKDCENPYPNKDARQQVWAAHKESLKTKRLTSWEGEDVYI